MTLGATVLCRERSLPSTRRELPQPMFGSQSGVGRHQKQVSKERKENE